MGFTVAPEVLLERIEMHLFTTSCNGMLGQCTTEVRLRDHSVLITHFNETIQQLQSHHKHSQSVKETIQQLWSTTSSHKQLSKKGPGRYITIYSKLADGFAWLCCCAELCLCLWAYFAIV